MRHLCDSNVFIALALEQHAQHAVARAWFEALPDGDTIGFCQATRLSFLRLLTQKVAEGYVPLTNARAWEVYAELCRDDAVVWESEPPSVDGQWKDLAAVDIVAPKAWMDAWLAAFALAGNLRLVTFDRDFRRFQRHGLNLELLGGVQ